MEALLRELLKDMKVSTLIRELYQRDKIPLRYIIKPTQERHIVQKYMEKQ